MLFHDLISFKSHENLADSIQKSWVNNISRGAKHTASVRSIEPFWFFAVNSFIYNGQMGRYVVLCSYPLSICNLSQLKHHGTLCNLRQIAVQFSSEKLIGKLLQFTHIHVALLNQRSKIKLQCEEFQTLVHSVTKILIRRQVVQFKRYFLTKRRFDTD